jgi:hypothetical protein
VADPKTFWGTCRHCDGRLSYGNDPDPLPYEEEEKPRTYGSRKGGARFRRAWYHVNPYEDDARVCPARTGTLPWRLYGEPKEFCQETMVDYGGVCNRPVKYTEDGNFLCGIHAKVLRQEQKRQREYQQQAEMREYVSESIGEMVSKIKKHFPDFKASIHYTGQYPQNLTGKIVVDPQWLIKTLGIDEDWEE